MTTRMAGEGFAVYTSDFRIGTFVQIYLAENERPM